MAASLYDASIPVFARMLGNLARNLSTAEAFADQLKCDHAVILQSRLYPDMFPLVRQVQVASDIAKGAGSRLSGSEPPSFVDDERSFADLRERIAKTRRLLVGLPKEAIENSAEAIIKFPIGGRTEELEGAVYLSNFVLPNFYFHVTTAYDILRHVGVPLGKKDYFLGGNPFEIGIRQIDFED